MTATFRGSTHRVTPRPPPHSISICIICRYALDVNISTLDVLNHKRLLDSARSDPTAVSFQVRPVDVITGADSSRKPSFGSLETMQMAHMVSTSPIHC